MRNKTGYFIAIILLLSSFFGCNKIVNEPNIKRTWELHKYKGYYSLAINFKNNDSCNYYLNNWIWWRMIKVLDEKGKDITYDYILYESSNCNEDATLANMIYEGYDFTKDSLANEIFSFKWIYLEPCNKEKIFLQKALEQELNWILKREKRHEKSRDYLSVFLYDDIYQSSLLLEKNSVIEDSLFINTLINLNEERTIVYSYRPILSEWKGYHELLSNQSDSFYYHGQPLKEIGGYTFYDKEFTDTIILRDGKIEVKYGN